jgi:hypothetical protein
MMDCDIEMDDPDMKCYCYRCGDCWKSKDHWMDEIRFNHLRLDCDFCESCEEILEEAIKEQNLIDEADDE